MNGQPSRAGHPSLVSLLGHVLRNLFGQASRSQTTDGAWDMRDGRSRRLHERRLFNRNPVVPAR